MAKRVTEADIIRINKLYKEIGTYAGVAKVVGFAPSTVKRYIIPDFKVVDDIDKKKVTKDEIAPQGKWQEDIKNYDFAQLCLLTDEDEVELAVLGKELIC